MFGWLSELFWGRHVPENLDEGDRPKSGARNSTSRSCVTVEKFGPITVVAFLPGTLGQESQEERESSLIQDKVNEVFGEVAGICHEAPGVVLLDFTQINTMGTAATVAICRLAYSAPKKGTEVAVCSLPAVRQWVLDRLWEDGALRDFRSFHNRLEAILTLLRLHSSPLSQEEREIVVTSLFQKQFACLLFEHRFDLANGSSLSLERRTKLWQYLNPFMAERRINGRTDA